MRLDYGRRRMPAGFFLFFLICIVIGAVTELSPYPAELEQTEECAPMEWRVGMDTEGWDLLIEQGYRLRELANGTALVPPGCEAAR